MKNWALDKKCKLNFADKSLQYSDDKFTYFILLDNGRISLIDILKKSTGEKFSSVLFSYEGHQIMFPTKVGVTIYSKDKIQLKKEFAFKQISTVTNSEAQKLFNTEGLGMFKFIDMRFSPPKTYLNDGGIPSINDAVSISDVMKFKDLTDKSEVDLNKARAMMQSSYINNVKDFFETHN